MEHRSFALASLLASVAFLETSINELFASADDPSLGFGGSLTEAERSALVRGYPLIARNGLLDRFQLALLITGRAPFDPGAQPYQDAKLLVGLRNELVHYKPRWRPVGNDASDSESESGLTRALSAKRFGRHPFMGAGMPFFPDQCLGHDATSWGWRSALGLVDGFCQRCGLVPIYDDQREDLQP